MTRVKMETKICKRCNVEKSVDQYYLVKNKSGSRPHTYCKECVKENNRKYRKKKKERVLEKEKALKEDEVGLKLCVYCGELKPNLIKNFRPDRGGCTDCERRSGREYRRSEHGKRKAKTWVEENTERMAMLQADWYQDNKPKIREKFVKRYHSDPGFKAKALTKVRIKAALKSYKEAGIFKSDKTVKYLGCTTEQYVEWIYHCFEDDKFTFDNHGTIWEYDHVIPLATFDLSDEATQKVAFNWRNVMPLSKKENMRKKDSIVLSQIKTHYDNLVSYHTEKGIEIPKTFKQLYAKHLTMAGNPLEP